MAYIPNHIMFKGIIVVISSAPMTIHLVKESPTNILFTPDLINNTCLTITMNIYF